MICAQGSVTHERADAEHQTGTIVQIAGLLAGALHQGGKILLCGNGGSAADAQHLAAELLVRLRPHINREAIPALSLAADMSSLIPLTAMSASGKPKDTVSTNSTMVAGLA